MTWQLLRIKLATGKKMCSCWVFFFSCQEDPPRSKVEEVPDREQRQG